MNIRAYASISFAYLKHRKIRAWLTIIGIVIGIAAIFALISAGSGLENALNYQFSKMGTQHLVITPGMRVGYSVGLSLDKDMPSRVENVKGVEYVIPIVVGNALVKYKKDENYLMVSGYDTSVYEKGLADLDIHPIQGRALKKHDRGVALLGYKAAKDAFDSEVTIRKKITVNGYEFKVIGILENTGTQFDERVYLPIEEAREVLNKTDEISIIRVKVLDGFDVMEVTEKIKRELLRFYDENDFRVFSPSQLVSQLGTIISLVEFILAGIAAISLLVGGIGIMNAMFSSVLERTREIGVMKAVGATNKAVMLVFLLESGFLGMFGGVAGSFIGYGFSKLIEFIAKSYGFEFLLIKFDIWLFLFCIGFAFLVGVISGLIPARRAAKLNPVDALHYE